jgi:hypothetical protein
LIFLILILSCAICFSKFLFGKHYGRLGQFVQYEFYSGMKAPDSAMPAGNSATSQKPAVLHRNKVLACPGLGCFLPPELGAALKRILHYIPRSLLRIDLYEILPM